MITKFILEYSMQEMEERLTRIINKEGAKEGVNKKELEDYRGRYSIYFSNKNTPES